MKPSDLEKGEKSPKQGSKVLVIGTGEFGSALAQSAKLAAIPDVDSSSFCTVVHVSARAFLLKQTIDEMAQVIAGSRYIMYCGTNLMQHSQRIARAMAKARSLPTAEPVFDFIDWSNPDPGSDRKGNIKGSVALTQLLEEADKATGGHSKPWWKVWKATGVSNLDVAGHEGKVKVTIYGGMMNASSGSEAPTIQIPGIVWRRPQQSSLLDEVYDRLITRSQVDRWYDATLLSLAIFTYAFVYAYTRYSKHVNGGYPDTMVPMYVADKGISWTSLWMMIVSPFAGNILAMGSAMKNNWSEATALDKILVVFLAVITLFPVVFFLPGLVYWCALRYLFRMGHQFNSKSVYQRQDDKPGDSLIKASLIDMVSLKHEAGVVGFFWVFAHTMMGPIIADKAYKKKWFQENGRFYGNIEISLILGVVGAALITAVTIRSLCGRDYWMKLKPMYSFISPLGIIMAALHVFFMGYTGWDGLFKYDVKKGQPSITFVSSMPTLIVLFVNLCLNLFGTKKRVGGQKIWKHSTTNAAHIEYEKIADQFRGTSARTRALYYQGPLDQFITGNKNIAIGKKISTSSEEEDGSEVGSFSASFMSLINA